MTKMAHQATAATGHKMTQGDSQIELLTPKQNGTAVDVRAEGAGSSSSSGKSVKASTIRGMWKKAFKSLQKTRPKGDKGEGSETRDKEDNGEDRKQYSRMPSRQSQSSLKKILKRKDSKEKEGSESEDTPKQSDNEDSVFSTLKYASKVGRQSLGARSLSLTSSEEAEGSLHGPSDYGREAMAVRSGSSHQPPTDDYVD